MKSVLNSPFNIGALALPNRLIQGPLAGFSCAPFRKLFYQYKAPGYCVSEMLSAQDVLNKHLPDSRYLYRAPEEKHLCYQLSGHHPETIAMAAFKLQTMGADLIDLNSGCPKQKIRKKKAGSALLDTPDQLLTIIRAMRLAITIPLTIKVRILGGKQDIELAQQIEAMGADALIVHGRRWTEEYDKPSDLHQIAKIKQAVSIPVIANGDIADTASLARVFDITNCDAYMISRAGTGKPWLYQQLLSETLFPIPDYSERLACFITHLQGLADLESEYKAVLQSKSLVRYYFREEIEHDLAAFYLLNSIEAIKSRLDLIKCSTVTACSSSRGACDEGSPVLATVPQTRGSLAGLEMTSEQLRSTIHKTKSH